MRGRAIRCNDGGLTLAAEAKRMRESFAVPESFADATYVSSH
ncbi:hypothetical protein X946_3377 [Burkholderia sp. ABCPW 111]|nr:hypothetical protein X946_3377 [Burkholderia sp. ABCPW 111]